MIGGLIGGVVLALLGLGFEIMAQTMRRTAMRRPEIVEQIQEIERAKEKAADLIGRLQTLQKTHSETVEVIENIKVQVKSAESRLPRVRQDYRVVEEIGVAMAKSKRFDGTVSHAKANAGFRPGSGKTPPGYYGSEVQIIVWADSLNEARRLFEETYPSKEGFLAIFHGEVFARA